MIEELIRTSGSKLPTYDRFESYELYPSNLNQPRKLLGYEDIFATIVRDKLFRVRRFEFPVDTLDENQRSSLVVVDMTDVYSNKSFVEFVLIKEYRGLTREISNRLFNVICNNRDYFWIITDYLKRHGDKFDVNNNTSLFEELQEYLISKIGDIK